jgi:hypothetical protein
MPTFPTVRTDAQPSYFQCVIEIGERYFILRWPIVLLVNLMEHF